MGLILRFVNLGLRAATLLSRFLLILVLAKLLSPAEVGLYGLLYATIAYVLMAVGFDFYTYATREFIVAEPRRRASILRDQAIFYVAAYVLILPACLIIFSLGYLPWALALWFFPLLVLEHIAQECNRVLIAMSEPLWASVVLFVRSGLWAVVAVVWMWLEPAQRTLPFVLGMWIVGGALACLLAAARLRMMDPESLRSRIRWDWIRRGVRVALPFLVATLSVRALYTADRYWMEAIHGLEVVAAYVLFIGIANAIGAFLEAAVFSFLVPGLVSAAGRADQHGFDTQMRRLAFQTVAATASLLAAALILAEPVVEWLDEPVYSENFGLVYWTVLGAALSAASMIPHYGLWARRRDRPIIVSHVVSVPVFAAALVTLAPGLGAAAAPAAIAVAFFFLLVAKFAAFGRAGPLVSPG